MPMLDDLWLPKILLALRKLSPGGAEMPIQIGSGMNFPVARLIELLEPAQWEEFTEEWATSLKSYKDVQRWSGPGEMGRDIVTFTTDKQYAGPWDNYQCKRYALKLQPNHVWVEFGNIIYHTFKGEFPPPANYYFAASKGVVGTPDPASQSEEAPGRINQKLGYPL